MAAARPAPASDPVGPRQASALHTAAAAGDIRALQQQLAEPDVDVNCRDADDCTPLHYAAAAGKLQVVQRLAEMPDCKINALNGLGQTALEVATQAQAVEVVRYLAAKDRGSRHYKLHWAAQHGHLQVKGRCVCGRGLGHNPE